MDETSTIKAPHPQNGDRPSHENRLRPDSSSGAAEVGREGREKGRVGPGRSRRLLKVLRLLAGTAILAAILAAAGAAWLVWRMRASLPRLQGEVEVFGLQGSVRILRDDLGIPTLKAAGLEDLAYATGFVHAQDRFFQMDLQRRVAAGELAELVGSLGLRLDRRVRIHRLRARAREMVAALPTFQRHVLQAYARGVAAGRHSLGAPPPEYLLLRARPVPWKSEDSLLVILSMFLDLQDASGWYESRMGLMHDLLPPSLFRFLTPQGTEWDAPVQGKALSLPQIPPADEVDIRTMEPWRILRSKVSSGLIPGLRVGGVGTGGRPHLGATVFQADPSFMAGSNNWAVAAAHTAAGGALLANDMHLALRLPNTWYRARLIWRPAGAAEDAQVTRATLPGVPGVVVGSNGHVAWGFTNSYADWSDLVVIQLDPDHPDSYLT
ncbi:MAG: penicillin acylase family protein, partial [Acidobacteriota bacterium]